MHSCQIFEMTTEKKKALTHTEQTQLLLDGPRPVPL